MEWNGMEWNGIFFHNDLVRLSLFFELFFVWDKLRCFFDFFFVKDKLRCFLLLLSGKCGNNKLIFIVLSIGILLIPGIISLS